MEIQFGEEFQIEETRFPTGQLGLRNQGDLGKAFLCFQNFLSDCLVIDLPAANSEQLVRHRMRIQPLPVLFQRCIEWQKFGATMCAKEDAIVLMRLQVRRQCFNGINSKGRIALHFDARSLQSMEKTIGKFVLKSLHILRCIHH